MTAAGGQRDDELAMDYLRAALGGHAVTDLGTRSPVVFDGLRRICRAMFSEHNALPARMREMFLIGIHAAKGNPGGVTRHVERAIAAGATPAEINEVLTAVLISRGLGAYALGSEALRTNDTAKAPVAATSSPPPMGLEQILAYFREVFGGIPQWVQDLVDTQPETFVGYYAMRSEILRDDVVPRKYKELALVALNASERYQDGLIVHTKGALTSGATERELLETMALAILTGGMVAWLEAAKTLKVVREEQATAT